MEQKPVLLCSGCGIPGLIGLAAVLVHLLIIEPFERKEMRADNNQLLYQQRINDALEQIKCPDGKILIIVPGIEIIQEGAPRRMLELYLLPANPTHRAIKLANTRFDGKALQTPDAQALLPEITTCLDSPESWSTLLQRMEEGVAAFQ